MFMDCIIRIRKQTYQCAQHKLKIVYETWQQKHSGKHFYLKTIILLSFHAVVLLNLSKSCTNN